MLYLFIFPYQFSLLSSWNPIGFRTVRQIHSQQLPLFLLFFFFIDFLLLFCFLEECLKTSNWLFSLIFYFHIKKSFLFLCLFTYHPLCFGEYVRVTSWLSTLKLLILFLKLLFIFLNCLFFFFQNSVSLTLVLHIRDFSQFLVIITYWCFKTIPQGADHSIVIVLCSCLGLGGWIASRKLNKDLVSRMGGWKFYVS